MSSGCNMEPPAEDSTTKFIKHEVHVTGLDPTYLTGGENFDSSGPYDFTFRPYSVRLPDGYDPSKPYAVTFGGGGCGGSAQNFAGNPGGGLQMAGNGNTIQIGLSYISGCFSDGGPAIDNRPDTPDEPYFRAVWDDVEKHYCIDKSQVFVGGHSSGAWEAYMLGCAASDIVRGIGTNEGGMRTTHPACKKPIAAVLVAGEADTENPIGPLDPVEDKSAIDRLGSFGSAPGRDEILKRNGCTGTDTVAYEDAKYGACKKYTGCPAAYPVVWCALPGVGHNSSTYMGTNYSPGPMWDVLSKLPKP
jgi:pimeloyl-ACP methyl ester carboxylesterase